MEHTWTYTGIIIDICPPFKEERCSQCGVTAWGGSRTGTMTPIECHGNPRDYIAWYKEQQRLRTEKR